MNWKNTLTTLAALFALHASAFGATQITACGKPPYDVKNAGGLYLWQDCNTRIWHLVTSGDPNQSKGDVYEGTFTSSGPIEKIDDTSIETNPNTNVVIDEAFFDGNILSFKLNVYNDFDAVLFRLPGGSNTTFYYKSARFGQPVILGANGDKYPVNSTINLFTVRSKVTPQLYLELLTDD